MIKGIRKKNLRKKLNKKKFRKKMLTKKNKKKKKNVDKKIYNSINHCDTIFALLVFFDRKRGKEKSKK